MASSVDITPLPSPFDDFLQKYVPREHEKALRNCFIQAIAVIFVGGILFGLYYVYSILDPFCVPLFWAVLSGTVLHPYKRRMTNSLRQGLEGLRKSERTMVVAVGVTLYAKVDCGAQLLAEQLLRSWRVLVAAALFLPCVYMLLCWSPATAAQALNLTQEIFLEDFSLFLDTVSLRHVAVSALISLVSILFGGPKYRTFYQLTSLVTWLLAGSYLCNFLWPPLVYLVALLLLLGYFSLGDAADETDGGESRIRSVFITALQQVGVLGAPEEADISPSKPGEEGVARRGSHPPTISLVMPPTPPERTTGRSNSVDAARVPLPPGPLPGVMESTPLLQHPGVSAIKKEHGLLGPRDRPNVSGIEARGGGSARGAGLGGNTPRSRTVRSFYAARVRERRRASITELRNSSMSYIYGAAWACALLQLWLRPAFLHLLPIPLGYYAVKRLLVSSGLAAWSQERLAELGQVLAGWLEEKRDLLFPPPVILVARVSYAVERKVLGGVIQHLDSLVTATMVLAMVLGATMVTIFISFQVYTESMYVVQSVGQVAATLNINDSYILTQLNHSLADRGFNMEDMDTMVDGAYNYGRDWISATLQRSLAEAEPEVRADLETKVLELWDRSYQYWVLTTVTPAQQGPVVSKEALTSSVGEVINKLFTSQLHASIFNYTAVQTFVKENMGTLTSIMETSWTLFKGNIGFLFDTLLGIVKIFFYGGTGFVNFIFGIVIYLTALFYLLSNSGNTYIPMDLVTPITLFQISGVGSSIQKAINSVFLITVKMSSFYLLWTYLTHVVFQASIVVLPLLFSSFIAACPFTGQHIVALPAALELWLLQRRPLAATLLVLTQVAPSWLVDAAIYSEIKGGIHPWFTGLAVVGGVYVFGVLGAIYGPLALCVLYVVINVYTTFMADTEPDTPDVRQSSGVAMRTPLLRTSTVM